MICPNCKKKIMDNVRFCSFCGADIIAYKKMYEDLPEKTDGEKNKIVSEAVKLGMKKTGEILEPAFRDAFEKMQKDLEKAVKKKTSRTFRDLEDRTGIKKKNVFEKMKDGIDDVRSRKRN